MGSRLLPPPQALDLDQSSQHPKTQGLTPANQGQEACPVHRPHTATIQSAVALLSLSSCIRAAGDVSEPPYCHQDPDSALCLFICNTFAGVRISRLTSPNTWPDPNVVGICLLFFHGHTSNLVQWLLLFKHKTFYCLIIPFYWTSGTLSSLHAGCEQGTVTNNDQGLLPSEVVKGTGFWSHTKLVLILTY